jgi:hypothetical protein
MKTKEEGTKCKSCGELPNVVKHCFDNSCYYNFRCNCKETPLRRSFGTAEVEWEKTFFKMDKSKMPQIKTKEGGYLI